MTPVAPLSQWVKMNWILSPYLVIMSSAMAWASAVSHADGFW